LSWCFIYSTGFAATYCTNQQVNSQAELTSAGDYISRWFTHPSTNQAQCRAAMLIETSALTPSQVASL